MPSLVALLAGVLIQVAASFALRAAAALGFGLVSYAGFSTLLSTLKDLIITTLTSGLTSQVVALLSLCGAGVAVSVIFSAFVIRATFAGLSVGGALVRWTAKA